MTEVTSITEEIVTFDFYNALKQVAGGKMIRRLSWSDNECYGFLVNGNLSLYKTVGIVHNWIVSLADMQGDDWVVL